MLPTVSRPIGGDQNFKYFWLAASSRILRILLSHLSGSEGWTGITIPKVHERVQLAKSGPAFGWGGVAPWG